MARFIEVEMDDGSKVYLEAEDDGRAKKDGKAERPTRGGGVLTSKGPTRGSSNEDDADEDVKPINHPLSDTIKSYTNYALNAFKQVGGANVDKVTLEFGIKVSGEAGVPFVTKGSTEGNLKVKVEFSFPEDV